jgi:hypothetical protein
MLSQETYTLEYCISTTQFPGGKELEDYVKQSLEKFLADIAFEIEIHETNYLILRVTSTAKVIDACHDKLKFEREWVFRIKDELGSFLRANAYPILAEIELCLRNFINQAMVEVLGFNWWNSFVPDSIREKVKEVEKKAGEYQLKFHHPIEYTLFEDLIKIVTADFQTWPDGHTITFSDLAELLSTSNSVEEIRAELENRRKVISLWDNVFSSYFDDKEAWAQLKKRIEGQVIPLRNKVMHHRVMREYELEQLKECRDEVNRVISLAKTELPDTELKEALQNAKIVLEGLRFQIDPDIFKGLTPKIDFGIDPEVLKALQRPLINPDIFKGLIPKIDFGIDPEVLKALQRPLINPEIFKGLTPKIDFGIDPEVLKALQRPLINPDIFKGLIPKMDLRLDKSSTEETVSSTTQEEIDSGKDESDVNGDDSQDSNKENGEGNKD